MKARRGQGNEWRDAWSLWGVVVLCFVVAAGVGYYYFAVPAPAKTLIETAHACDPVRKNIALPSRNEFLRMSSWDAERLRDRCTEEGRRRALDGLEIERMWRNEAGTPGCEAPAGRPKAWKKDA